MEEDRKMEKIAFADEETGEAEFFYVLQQTTINGKNYLLVVDREETDVYEFNEETDIAPCMAMILEEKPGTDSDEDDFIYEVVDDEDTLETIAKVFEEEFESLEIDY